MWAGLMLGQCIQGHNTGWACFLWQGNGTCVKLCSLVDLLSFVEQILASMFSKPFNILNIFFYLIPLTICVSNVVMITLF